MKPFLRNRTNASAAATRTKTRMCGKALESKYFGEMEFGKIISDAARSEITESSSQRRDLALDNRFGTFKIRDQ